MNPSDIRAPVTLEDAAPVIEEIAFQVSNRERSGRRPFEEIEMIRGAGLGALRLPEPSGAGIGGVDLFRFVIDLAEADADAAHALRSHYAFVEAQLVSADPLRERWLGLVADDHIFGNAITEIGGKVADAIHFDTRLERDERGLVLNGTKFFSTGSIFADDLWVLASDESGATVQVIVPADREGVALEDDWNGIGQRFTGSGTTVFEGVRVEEDEVSVLLEPGAEMSRGHIDTFFQLYLWAVVAGILRLATREASEMLAGRERSYAHGLTPRPADDPLMQQFLGEIASTAYAAEALVLAAAELLDPIVESASGGILDEGLVHDFQLRVAQVQVHLTGASTRAADTVFSLGGASATRSSLGLDRHWRNIRTIASHNPSVYKAQRIGEFIVNGSRLPTGAYW